MKKRRKWLICGHPEFLDYKLCSVANLVYFGYYWINYQIMRTMVKRPTEYQLGDAWWCSILLHYLHHMHLSSWGHLLWNWLCSGRMVDCSDWWEGGLWPMIPVVVLVCRNELGCCKACSDDNLAHNLGHQSRGKRLSLQDIQKFRL